MLLWAATSCVPDRERELLKAAPRLSSEMAHHLVVDHDSSFHAYCRDVGHDAVQGASSALMAGLAVGSIEEFHRAEAPIQPHLARITTMLESEFGMDRQREWLESFLALPAEGRHEVALMRAEHRRLLVDATLSVEERERALRELIARSLPYGRATFLSSLYGFYAELLPRLNRHAEMPDYLRLAIAFAREEGNYLMACQLLGTLGYLHRESGDYESMVRCWDEAVELARRIKSSQEARILSFYARYFEDQGSLALARDLLIQAQEVCRANKAYSLEIRFLFSTLEFYADLDCWNLVGEGLSKAEILRREQRRGVSPSDASTWSIRTDWLRARYLHAMGEHEQANEIFARLEGSLTASSPDHAKVRLEHASTLVACGKPRSALQVLRAGSELCAQYGVLEYLTAFDLASARAALASGDVEGSAEALQRFRSRPPGEQTISDLNAWLEHDALAIRIALAQDDRTEVLAGFNSAFGRMQRHNATLGRTAEAYLMSSGMSELRALGDSLLEEHPDAGYAFEMVWRSLSKPGGNWNEAPSPLRLLQAPGTAGDHLAGLRKRMRELDAIHCVYHVGSREVVRWTTDGRATTRDVLPVTPAQLEGRIAEIQATLAVAPEDSAATLGGATAAELRDLARALLPEDLRRRESGERRLIVITPDGALSLLPFETLNLADSGYVPLLHESDVVYLRSWTPNAARSAAARAVVVTNPEYPPDLQRRYSVLRNGLPHGLAESALIRRSFPGALLLEGRSATKEALTGAWEGAGLLYVASHVVRNPEIPYLTFIPMAAPGSRNGKDAYLGIEDVLAADLSDCRLVVLSSCSSGSTYVDKQAVAPSLGEAFIDAGAGAVIHTMWDIDDEDGAALMRGFTQSWREERVNPIVALGDARRRFAAERAPHPHFWAAYSIMAGRL